MIDVQSQEDKREVYLNEVGISGLRFPAFIENAKGKGQATVIDASLSVDLNFSKQYHFFFVYDFLKNYSTNH